MSLFSSLVEISSNDKKSGLGFIVDANHEEFYYVITCNHVLYHSGDAQKLPKITVDAITISPENILLGSDQAHKVDMALIKIPKSDLKNHHPISLQSDSSYSKKILLKTIQKAGNDELSSHSRSITLSHKKDAELRYDSVGSNAYTFESEQEIIGGYSGSPIIDEETKKGDRSEFRVSLR